MRVLFIAHNDPSFHPGGTEIFAKALFREVKTRPDVEAYFLACVDGHYRSRRPGTAFQTIAGGGASEYLLWSGHFDWFHLSQNDHVGVFTEFVDLLRTLRPDVVHFHHVLLIGLEALAVVRRVLPRARILLTLHDYYLLCYNDGTLRTPQGRLCPGPTPDRCRACHPKPSATAYALKTSFAKASLRHVDHLIAPSQFLRDRFVAWGVDPASCMVLRNGILAEPPAAHRPLRKGERRARFGVFGNVNEAKGTLVALNAITRLRARGHMDAVLEIHGDLLFPDPTFKEAFETALAAAGPAVIHKGGYDRADLPTRMAGVDWCVMPSVWYENAPLTIQEAFLHQRPVICSGIGGMAEMVTHGRDGLLVPPGDVDALADTMERAVTDPDLWPALVRGLPAVRDIADCADEHVALYAGQAPMDAAEIVNTEAQAGSRVRTVPEPDRPNRAEADGYGDMEAFRTVGTV